MVLRGFKWRSFGWAKKCAIWLTIEMEIVLFLRLIMGNHVVFPSSKDNKMRNEIKLRRENVEIPSEEAGRQERGIDGYSIPYPEAAAPINELPNIGSPPHKGFFNSLSDCAKVQFVAISGRPVGWLIALRHREAVGAYCLPIRRPIVST